MRKMKICNFCGYRTDDNSVKTCASCGSKQFSYVCPNCSAEFEGKFCPTCGTKHDAVAKICPDCGEKYFSKSCPNCGYNASRRRSANQARSEGSQLYDAPANGQINKSCLTAFSMSITGFLTCMFPLSLASLLLALKQNKNENLDQRSKTFNNVALALSVTGLFMDVMFVFAFIVGNLSSAR